MNLLYEYKGVKYIVKTEVEMKNPETREWKEAVLYEDIKGRKYVREREDFLNKFKKVEDG